MFVLYTLVAQKYDPSNLWGYEKNIAASQIKKNFSFLVIIRSTKCLLYKHDVIERRNRKFVFDKMKKLVDSENDYSVGGFMYV